MVTAHIGEDGAAVLVSGERITDLGAADALLTRYPLARVRRWAGAVGPARVWDGPLPDAPTARERVHGALRLGVGALRSSAVTDPAERAAAERVGVVLLTGPAGQSGLRVGDRADFAVHARDGACVATVLAGRIVHRSR